MTASVERDVHCPRCKYCLRGIPEPRCPECGLQFTQAELASGLLRENRPTWLDRADLWQPHQVLIRSLVVLVVAWFSPIRLFKRLDVNGSLAAAVVMAVVGMMWTWLVTAGLVAFAVAYWMGASPAAAGRCSMLVWTPRLVGTVLLSALGTMPLLVLPEVVRVAQPSWRQRVRVWAHMLPVLTAAGSWPAAGLLCFAPEFAVPLCFAWPALPLILALWAWHVQARSSSNKGRQALGGLAIAAVCALGAMGIASRYLPGSLEPPWWVYFM